MFGELEPRWYFPSLYHSFYRNTTWGRVHFIALDTESIIQEYNDYFSQTDWLENQLRTTQVWRRILIFTLNSKCDQLNQYLKKAVLMKEQLLFVPLEKRKERLNGDQKIE